MPARRLMEMLDAMLGGPGRLRFIIQPILAALIGARDGRRDAMAGLPPYVIAVLFSRELRAADLRVALRSIAIPLAVAILLDMILQQIIFGRVRFWIAVVVGAGLIALPYTVARALSNRFIFRRRRRRDAEERTWT